jgi:predicted alpha/beta superfamily hydrolase
MIAAVAAGILIGQQRVHSLTGNIKFHNGFESKVLGNKRNIAVYLPPGYEKDQDTKYSVLYMADGQNCFDGMTSYIPNQEWRADETAEELIKKGQIEPLIIVAIDNAQADRANEYLPTRSKWSNNEAGGKANLYLKFLRSEVMPVIERTYRVKTGPSHTGVCGSSFGGILSLYLIGSAPETFGKAAVVSPSLWWDNRSMLKWSEDRVWKDRARIWLDIGTGEGSQTVEYVQKLSEILTAKGLKPDTDLVCLVEPGAEHNEKAWAKRFPMMLKFLFPAKK